MHFICVKTMHSVKIMISIQCNLSRGGIIQTSTHIDRCCMTFVLWRVYVYGRYSVENIRYKMRTWLAFIFSSNKWLMSPRIFILFEEEAFLYIFLRTWIYHLQQWLMSNKYFNLLEKCCDKTCIFLRNGKLS